jgi:hypothetical protein
MPRAIPTPTTSRRAALAGSAAASLAGAATATAVHGAAVGPGADAELIRTRDRFVEGEFTDRYRSETPTMTPAGWRVKALAYTARHHQAYGDLVDDRPVSWGENPRLAEESWRSRPSRSAI